MLATVEKANAVLGWLYPTKTSQSGHEPIEYDVGSSSYLIHDRNWN